MSTFILCPEPGISSFFRRMTAQLRVFFSRNNLSYYSRWYTNPAGNLSVRVCMFRRGGARHLGYESGGDQLKSGLFRPFLWHIRAKGHRLGAVMEMEAWRTWKNGCNDV
ncbi:hypothetical protein P2P31_24980, partial [Escherichia coli]